MRLALRFKTYPALERVFGSNLPSPSDQGSRSNPSGTNSQELLRTAGPMARILPWVFSKTPPKLLPDPRRHLKAPLSIPIRPRPAIARARHQSNPRILTDCQPPAQNQYQPLLHPQTPTLPIPRSRTFPGAQISTPKAFRKSKRGLVCNPNGSILRPGTTGRMPPTETAIARTLRSISQHRRLQQ